MQVEINNLSFVAAKLNAIEDKVAGAKQVKEHLINSIDWITHYYSSVEQKSIKADITSAKALKQLDNVSLVDYCTEIGKGLANFESGKRKMLTFENRRYIIYAVDSLLLALFKIKRLDLSKISTPAPAQKSNATPSRPEKEDMGNSGKSAENKK